jgi:L-alanine-DL-glutamate epimerase-like enolase superfamily enzyme
VSTYERIAGLPVAIESFELEGLEQALGAEFTRYTTQIRLRGDGEEGIGEDVTYDGIDHANLQAAGGSLPLTGDHTIDSFSRRLEELELFPDPPVREMSHDYRRWAFESAALDLALRQAGRSLADALGREPRPVNYVVSMRLGAWHTDEPDTTEKLNRVLSMYPTTRFKLDPTKWWTAELIQELVDTGAVDSVDLKGMYKGTPVDLDTDPELYRRVVEAFPNAWIEDPDINDETRPVLEPHKDRVTWDAPIHSVADIEAREWKPKMVNIKPSRFGPLSRLMETYDYCEREGIGAYGGGQTELGVGRGHIQYLASLFHPDTPNDTAPGGFNMMQTPEGLPTSPLEPRIDPAGFRWVS